MKLPKSFYKLSLQEQERYLVDMKSKMDADYSEMMRMLATVRGGYKYEASTEVDRPDLLSLKGGEGI
jgi:hypothetical protein